MALKRPTVTSYLSKLKLATVTNRSMAQKGLFRLLLGSTHSNWMKSAVRNPWGRCSSALVRTWRPLRAERSCAPHKCTGQTRATRARVSSGIRSGVSRESEHQDARGS
jgi:hypothetical protein